MSLINDALKRASEAEKRRAGMQPGARRGPKGPEALGPPIEPVKKPAPSLLSRPDFWSAMFTFVFVIVSAAFFYSWWKARPKAFTLHVPPGKDALEMMIIDSRPKMKPVVQGPVVVDTNGVVGLVSAVGDTNVAETNVTDATTSNLVATNVVTTNHTTETNGIAVAETNTVEITPPKTTNVVTTTRPDIDPRTRPDAVKPPVAEVATNAPTLLKPTGLPSLESPGGMQGELVTTSGPDKIDDKKPEKKPAKTKPFPEISFKGIAQLKDGAVAFVNGKVITVGDRIEGVELVEIGIDYVKFSREDEVRQFYLVR